jgi:CBS domain-containing protein
MHVRDLLRRKKDATVISIPGSADIGTAARLLMRHGIGGLPVVSEGGLAGFLSEREVVQAVHRTGDGIRSVRVDEAMRRPAPTCSSDDRVEAVMARMNRERLRHLVVLDGTVIAGVLSVGDLVKHRLEELETETGVLRDYVVAQRARG